MTGSNSTVQPSRWRCVRLASCFTFVRCTVHHWEETVRAGSGEGRTQEAEKDLADLPLRAAGLPILIAFWNTRIPILIAFWNTRIAYPVLLVHQVPARSDFLTYGHDDVSGIVPTETRRLTETAQVQG